MKRILSAAAGITLLFTAVTASAIPKPPGLTLYDPDAGVTLTVADGGAGDCIDIPGIVGYMGPVGHWFLSVTTGNLQPEDGGAPSLHLNSVDNTFKGSGRLVITLSDYISNWSGPGAAVSVGGTLGPDGTKATFDSFVNGMLMTTMNFTTNAGHGFSGNETFGYTPAEDLAPGDLDGSLDLVELTATIAHPYSVYGVTSFDYELNPIPEPGTMMLFGSALLACAIYAKRRFYKRI